MKLPSLYIYCRHPLEQSATHPNWSVANNTHLCLLDSCVEMWHIMNVKQNIYERVDSSQDKIQLSKGQSVSCPFLLICVHSPTFSSRNWGGKEKSLLFNKSPSPQWIVSSLPNLSPVLALMRPYSEATGENRVQEIRKRILFKVSLAPIFHFSPLPLTQSL